MFSYKRETEERGIHISIDSMEHMRLSRRDIYDFFTEDKGYLVNYENRGYLIKFTKPNEDLINDINDFIDPYPLYKRESISFYFQNKFRLDFELNRDEREQNLLKTEIIDDLRKEQTRLLSDYKLSRDTKNDTASMKVARERVHAIDVVIKTISDNNSTYYDIYNAVGLVKANSKSTGKYFGAISRFLNSKFGIFKSDGEIYIDTVLNKLKLLEKSYNYISPGKKH